MEKTFVGKAKKYPAFKSQKKKKRFRGGLRTLCAITTDCKAFMTDISQTCF